MFSEMLRAFEHSQNILLVGITAIVIENKMLQEQQHMLQAITFPG